MSAVEQEAKGTNCLENIGRQLEQLSRGLNAQIENEDVEFEVVEILAWRRLDDIQREFLVRWEDYPPDYDEWVPENNMNCAELLESFLAKDPNEYFENASDSADDDNSQDDDNTDDDCNDQVEPNVPSIIRKLKCIVCDNEFPILLTSNMPRMRDFVCSTECATKGEEIFLL